jgi:hypothetical protein
LSDTSSEPVKVSLIEWLRRLQTEDTEATAYNVRVTCDLSLFRGQDKDGAYTGGIGIQVNFPGSDKPDVNGIVYGFLHVDHSSAASPEQIADTLKQAFGLDVDTPMWELQDISHE